MSLIDPAPTRPDISARDDAARDAATGARIGMSRRGFLVRSFGAVGFFGASTAGYATAIEPERLVTTTYRITPPGWRSGRLTVVAIADLHAGGPNMTLEHIVRTVDRTNALAPDLVVLLGDYFASHRFVTEHVPNAVWAGEFSRLKAPLGLVVRP
jgi:predicted MPP superfamily phosphohydrolase